MLDYAYRAYYGGKFEVTARGLFSGFEYDISSAYPYELAQLKDISNAHVRYFKDYAPDADYGFMHVKADIPPGFYHTIPVKKRGLSYYPAGRVEAWITKAEYEFMLKYGVSCSVIDGWYLYCPNAPRRYAEQINYLYGIKQDKAGQEPIIRDCAKIIMNGFYGKNAQIIEQPDGTFIAGSAFNPVYAAVITANCRLRIAEQQNKLGKDCLAVHTDSIITRHAPPELSAQAGLGAWEAAASGQGVVIACGLYQIGAKSKFRGFKLSDKISWLEILEGMGTRDKEVLSELRVWNWIHTSHLDAPDKTNIFEDIPKEINLNCDNKRLWLARTNAALLLAGVEQSIPRVVEHWA
jgi:hypothetical protein